VSCPFVIYYILTLPSSIILYTNPSYYQPVVEMQQAQQQQIEHQNQLRIQQEEEEKMRLDNSSRPEEHFLTIALNGTCFILLLGVFYIQCLGGMQFLGSIFAIIRWIFIPAGSSVYVRDLLATLQITEVGFV